MDYLFLFQKYVIGNHGGWRYRRKYEREVQKVIRKIKGNLFIDIGANNLFFSNRFSKNFTKIIAVEPNKNLKPMIKSPNIELLNIAISDNCGEATLYCYGNGGAESLIRDFDYFVVERKYAPAQFGPFKTFTESFQVKVFTFDSLIHQVADLVKIDVEGAEFKVLNGMTKYLPKNIIVEIHDERRTSELIKVLESKGYSTKLIEANHLWGWII